MSKGFYARDQKFNIFDCRTHLMCVLSCPYPVHFAYGYSTTVRTKVLTIMTAMASWVLMALLQRTSAMTSAALLRSHLLQPDLT